MHCQINLIQPQGIFDGKKSRVIYQEISEIIALDTKIILIDFKGVTFMDSAGFGNLLLMVKKVQQQQGRLVFCSITDQIKMLFNLTNTNNLFEVFPDVASFTQTITEK
ncbi:MAG: STAS domain-containing protein [Stigonema ocellatum SAG 48.90 = DSM 106950]|nr:STAS domain-containing protein [Stigonema ocellatum SAG 48.90 = DSM 106950]